MNRVILTILMISAASFASPTDNKPPPEPCIMAIEDLQPILGLRFGMKINEVKKTYKTAKPRIFANKPKQLSDTELYEIRGAEISGSRFKTSLQSVEFTYEPAGITAISLNFRPPVKAASIELFTKINEELGLLESFWLARNFGGASYLQWNARCDGFMASVVIQPGYFARLSMYSSFGPRQKRKPRNEEPVGD